MSEIGSLLGRWHQWRSGYSIERRFARADALAGDGMHDEEDFERELMQTLESTIDHMNPRHQMALQHVARYECMGVEVMFNPRLPENKARREALCEEAQRILEKRLIASGLL